MKGSTTQNNPKLSYCNYRNQRRKLHKLQRHLCTNFIPKKLDGAVSQSF